MPGVVALCHPNQAVLAANINVVRSMELWSIAVDTAEVREALKFCWQTKTSKQFCRSIEAVLDDL